jgi:outer membrane lipoprotein LolB
VLTAAFAINGRVSIDQQGKRQSAGLRWTHRGDSDELELRTPLGQTVARIYRDAARATLDKGSEHYSADSAESLMDQVLGWHMPLGGLHRWVLAMPDDEPGADIRRDDAGRISLLSQAGWQVQYLRYADAAPDSLPSRLKLDSGDLHLQILIDEWEWNPQ